MDLMQLLKTFENKNGNTQCCFEYDGFFRGTVKPLSEELTAKAVG